MKKLCMILGVTLEALGVIGSFVLANSFGKIDYLGYSERNWTLTIVIFLGCLVTSSATAFTLIGISTILERLENIEYYNEQSARKESEKERVLEEQGDNYWKCPNCGKFNPNYTGTCSCGEVRK